MSVKNQWETEKEPKTKTGTKIKTDDVKLYKVTPQ